MYAIRVSVIVPSHRGHDGSCRASFQRTPPSGSNATSSFRPVAIT